VAFYRACQGYNLQIWWVLDIWTRHLEDLDAAVQEIDPDFLVIDYVQLMGSRTGRNRAEAISEVSGYLNSLTRRKKGHVVSLPPHN